MSTVRHRNPKGSGAQLRVDLVAVAARLIDEHGDAADVSLRAVAGAVGVAPTAVYLHFADRDELMLAVLEDRFAAFHATIEAADDHSDHEVSGDEVSGDGAGGDAWDALDALRRRGVAYIQFALAQPGAYRMMFSHRGVNLERQELYARYVTASMPAYESLVAAVQRCIDQGSMTGDAAVLANVVWSVVHGYSDLVNVGVPFFQTPDDFFAGFVGTLSGADPVAAARPAHGR